MCMDLHRFPPTPASPLYSLTHLLLLLSEDSAAAAGLQSSTHPHAQAIPSQSGDFVVSTGLISSGGHAYASAGTTTLPSTPLPTLNLTPYTLLPLP
ncbi:hypothetical protein K431DRAFT_280681 [Polychaeton citri CBS 116435]|uniref:REJ domain-containing protein n=1 Tax=Polychaeton citri CBS 116435 TaxID=1314669 RepID=A0A9P4URS2_9PEZI|nr:hypothetical protein K431DRAFT_280681 [Polychaeton citri CBS 116435]